MQLESCDGDERGGYVATGTVKNSQPGVADYQISLNFENDLGIHIASGSRSVNQVQPGQEGSWEIATPIRPTRGSLPYDPKVVGCSLEVFRVVDGRQNFARATTEYAEQANRICASLHRMLDQTAQQTGSTYGKHHADLSRPALARLRRLEPTRQDLELLEAFEEWEQFLDQEEEFSKQQRSNPDEALDFEWVRQPGFDAGGALAQYGLEKCAGTLPSGG